MTTNKLGPVMGAGEGEPSAGRVGVRAHPSQGDELTILDFLTDGSIARDCATN